jgi:hypothetical protein
MSIIRPAVAKMFSRWSEVIFIALGMVLFGFLTLRATGVFLPFVYGAVTAVFGIALFVAIRRARVSLGANVNSGHVEIDERQITFFQLGQSWSVSLNDLTSVVIETTDDGPFEDDVFWIIRDVFGSVVRIPNMATGNEKLFDAVSALKGVSFDQIANAMGSTSPAVFTIWSKG